LRIVALLLCDPLIVEFVMLALPNSPVKSSPFSASALPLFITRLLARVKPVTLLPRIPSSPPPVTRIRERLTLDVLLRLMPAPVELWIVPPVQVGVATVQDPPLPPTVSPPLDPVLLSTIPFTAPFEEMLRNLRPEAPIVVLDTLSALPVVVVSVLAVSVAVTVPPPVALNAVFVPVLRFSVPVKLIDPVLLVSSTPLP
jgi:hypothetical protein